MASAVQSYLDLFESTGFTNTVISVNDVDVGQKLRCLGRSPVCVTIPCIWESQKRVQSSVSPAVAWALGAFSANGIGDTIRISISDDNFYEIAAKELLRTVGIEKGGVQLISCPVAEELLSIRRDLSGESKNAFFPMKLR